MSEGAYWAVITAPILESGDVSDGAKLFYCEVSRRTNQRGYCWASNEALATDLGVCARTVSRYVSELEDAGFITTEQVGVRDRKRRHERHIRLAVPVPFDVDKNVYVNVDKNGELNVDKNVHHHKENNKSKNNNPLEPPLGGRRVPEPAKWRPDRFESFWEYYRQNVNPANRAAARKAWDKLKPDDDVIHDIGMALKARLRTDEEWKRGIGRPHASTYLNGQQWLDCGPTAPRPGAPSEPEREEDEFL